MIIMWNRVNGILLFTQCCADQQVITKLRGKGLLINKGSRIVITFCPFGSRVPRSTSIKCYGRLQPRLTATEYKLLFPRSHYVGIALVTVQYVQVPVS
jgi:hypothetical protein